MQKAINLLEASSKWNDHMSMKAHELSVHGEKRVEREEARKEMGMRQHFQHLALDLFDAELYPNIGNMTTPQVTNITAYFETYIQKLWALYSELHAIANDLVIAGYKPISEPLYEYIECIQKDIIEAKRLAKEYKLANNEFHHISRYEVSYRNVHDDMEKKEKSEGYLY